MPGLVVLWRYPLKTEEEEDLDPAVLTEVAPC